MFEEKVDNKEPSAQQELIGDRYQVIESLGKGGMGVVVKARHVGLGKLVAIKVLNAALLVDEISRKRFEIEAKAAANLAHPNLISVFDYGFTEKAEPFIVMEYIEGDSLGDYIEKHSELRFEDFVDIFLQIAKALQYVHNNNIIHRDLKPGNVMVHVIGDERYVKLLDFGIAKVFNDDGQPAQHLTATGAAFGSPLYMSPEQCQGMKVDARADIYSFGCVMYECIAGDPPIIGDNALHTIFKQVSDLPPMLPSSSQSEHQLAQIVDKCLQKKPADRFQNVGELLLALGKLRPGVINQTGSMEQVAAPKGQQVGGIGAKWAKRVDDPTTFTPAPAPSPVPSPQPASWTPSQLVAPPAKQQPPADDWVGSTTKKMFKVFLLIWVGGMLIGAVYSIVQFMWIAPKIGVLKNDLDARYDRIHEQLEKMNQRP